MRTCSTCGRPYSRRNLVEVWVVQNPGSRLGWIKSVIRQCLKCSPEAATRRMLMVANVVIGKRGGVRRRA